MRATFYLQGRLCSSAKLIERKTGKTHTFRNCDIFFVFDTERERGNQPSFCVFFIRVEQKEKVSLFNLLPLFFSVSTTVIRKAKKMKKKNTHTEEI